jgi:hypothetical protein
MPLRCRDAPRTGVIPGYYCNLTDVNFAHFVSDPHDDVYGCNMHRIEALLLHGVAMTDAAFLKKVINIFGVFKAAEYMSTVSPLKPSGVSNLNAKTTTPRRASHNRITSHTYYAMTMYKPPKIRLMPIG